MKTPKEWMQRAIVALPGGEKTLDACFRILDRFRMAKQGREAHRKQVFRNLFATNKWGSAESVSGGGSEMASTENVRKEIPRLVAERGVQTLLDAPCGDYNWFRTIQWRQPIAYVGGDIVPELIANNQARYGDARTRFVELDVVHDDLPAADLWLCRHCLIHLPNRDILLAIDNFLNSDVRYLLTTTNSECRENKDIPTGWWRQINLQLPPFDFCPPLETIADWIPGYPVGHLALWERESLKTCLAANAEFQRVARARKS